MLSDSKPSWDTAKNILAIRLDTMGDVLMTSPAIKALKESLPGRRITLLTSTNGAEVASLIPEIDDIITYNAPWMKATAPLTDSRADYIMAARLRQAGFDAAVIFTVFSQNPLPAAFLCYLSTIPLRLAFCRENPYQLLTHWVKDPEPEEGIRHEVQRQLNLVATVGATIENDRLSLKVPDEASRMVSQMLSTAGLDQKQPWTVVHPGASAPSRRYPPESYAAVIRMLVESGVQIVFTGSKTERPLIRKIQNKAGVPTISMGGRLNLSQLAALIAQAPLLISNNTGPVHIAAATGTPVVDLYALTNPQHTPWKVSSRILFHDVPCKFCYKSKCPMKHHDCLRKVKPEEVFQAACELLGLLIPVKPITVNDEVLL